MRSTSLRPRIQSVQPAQSATLGDLTDRQVGMFVIIAAAVLSAALVLLAIYGTPDSYRHRRASRI